jgi:hypothetical protein
MSVTDEKAEMRGRIMSLNTLNVLNRHCQFDPVVRSVDQIQLGAEVPLGRLDRRMAQQQLDLLKLPADGAA